VIQHLEYFRVLGPVETPNAPVLEFHFNAGHRILEIIDFQDVIDVNLVHR